MTIWWSLAASSGHISPFSARAQCGSQARFNLDELCHRRVEQDRRPAELLTSDAELRQQSSSRVTPSRSSFLHRVVSHGVGPQNSTEIRARPEIASVATASRQFGVIRPPPNDRALLRVGNSIKYRPKKHKGGGGEVIRYFDALLRFRVRRADNRGL
jgi:hypothetical protein